MTAFHIASDKLPDDVVLEQNVANTSDLDRIPAAIIAHNERVTLEKLGGEGMGVV